MVFYNIVKFSDFDNKSSNNSAALPHNSSTIYTPSSQQKRFNPFMKESPIQVVVTPLTPTKEHPLKASTEDSSEQSEDDSNVNVNGSIEQDVNKNNQIPEIDDNHNTNSKNGDALAEESTEEDGKGVVKTLLPPGKVVKRKKNLNSSSKGSRPNSLNRNSLQLNSSDVMSSSTDSTDKLEGKDFISNCWLVLKGRHISKK